MAPDRQIRGRHGRRRAGAKHRGRARGGLSLGRRPLERPLFGFFARFRFAPAAREDLAQETFLLKISAAESSTRAKVWFMSSLEELLAAIRRLPLAERLRLIERASMEAAEDTPQPASVGRRLSVDEFLAARLTPPPGVGPVTLQDIERAIAEGASGRGSA